MLEPIGPLPATVYWRRRAVAVGGAIVMLFVLIWLVAATGGDNQVQPAAQELPTTTTVPPTSAGVSETSTTTSEAPISSSSVTTTTSITPPPTPTSTPAATTAPAVGPQPCPDEVTRVVAEPERQQYPVGDRPVFRLSVTNTGTAPCVRDLDASLQELLVYAADGTTRIWSSNDCYPSDSNDVRTLQPGEPAMFSVTWAGRTSQPGCSGQRVAVPAGEYRVVGKLGPLTSAPATFRLVN